MLAIKYAETKYTPHGEELYMSLEEIYYKSISVKKTRININYLIITKEEL